MPLASIAEPCDRTPEAMVMADPSVNSSACPCVLILEDDADARNALVRLLSDAGWQVEAVGSVAGALKALAANPSFAVLDLNLPDGDSGAAKIDEARILGQDICSTNLKWKFCCEADVYLPNEIESMN